jgi:hypothetical protein
LTATPDIIPSDLTLEIGDNLSPERFLAAVRAFFGYVKEVENLVAPEGEDVGWTVHVREGSSLIGMEPTPSMSANVVQLVYSRVEEGIRRLSAGDIDGAHLPEPALKHLRTLSEMTDGPRGVPTKLRLWVKKKPVSMEPEIGRAISEDWRADYSDYGTIEGRLETIQDYRTLEIRIRDVAFKSPVRCRFPEKMLPNVFDNFRKRVEVSGVIHFRKNGTPISIEVEDISRLPDDAELPTASDVKGILRIA